MQVAQQVAADLNQAMRDRQELVVLTLRGLKQALLNEEIANSRQPLSPDQEVKVLRREGKKRQEAAEVYRQGGRQDLAEKEEAELAVIQHYLPAELPVKQVRQQVRQVISDLGASRTEDLGRVMGAVMPKLSGQVDGRLVKQIAAEELAKG